LFLAACGNRGPLVLPEDPPPPMPAPAEQAKPADADAGKDGAGR
jgi:predicted small lipoprotein YifL